MANQQAAHAAFEPSVVASRPELAGAVVLDAVDTLTFRRSAPARAAAKRVLDIVVALAAAIVFLPLMLVIAVAVALTHRGSVLVTEWRVGLDGERFAAVRFRTQGESNRHRSPLGRALYRSRLDELPQIINVLLGDLSVVGPSAASPEETARLTAVLRGYGLRHLVRPGLTGWSQTMGDWSHGDASRRLAYDLYYVRHCGLWMDLRILARTAFLMLLGRTGR
ncbi:MAG: sugar transferase [Alphaproteobacteria bacterium]|nr:sugar transferase [Alphaproteobacteria bacterium]